MYEVRNIYLEHITKEDLKGALDLGVKMHKIDYYYCILHDKDKKEDGTLKKEHFHLYIECEDIKQAKEYIRELIYKETTFNRVQTPKSAILYLVHKKDSDKYQYSTSEVFSNNIDYVIDTISNYKPKAIKTINKITNEMLIDYLETKCNEALLGCAMIFESDIIQWCRELEKRDYYLKNKNRIIDYFTSVGITIIKGKRNTEKNASEKIEELFLNLQDTQERNDILETRCETQRKEIAKLYEIIENMKKGSNKND